ncbi:MAG TPA: FecR domain-containing protein [Rhizomicrobium sp.]|nr:FecR domain-containing protein [Rhizomicrobium sp.]
MNTRYSPQEIDRVAAEWAARRCSGLTPAEALELSRWLEADPRHVGAYAKAEAVLAQLDRIGAAGRDMLQAAQPSSLNGSAFRRRALLTGSVAAGLLVTAGGAVWLKQVLGEESYSTRIGETKEIVLSDGSMVTLNTDSKIVAHYSETRRQIQLLQGEALFDVAKNKKRPFIVTAGDTQVRAVGTSFTVKLLPQQPVQVLVREGVVEIKRPQVPQAPPVRLAANTLALAPPEAPISTAPVPVMQVSRDLAWREGRIAFDNETLANAAREFERYSDIQIRVAPELGNQTITGLFVSNDPVGFAKAAAISLNLRVEVANREVRLSRVETVTDR